MQGHAVLPGMLTYYALALQCKLCIECCHSCYEKTARHPTVGLVELILKHSYCYC